MASSGECIVLPSAEMTLDPASIAQICPRRLAEMLIDAAAYDTSIRRRLMALCREPRTRDAPMYMVGECPALLEVFDRIRRFAPTDAPILITGESGTGKELAASAIHQRSRRAGGPFVALNCAALPPSLIASELFGHEKGAFTGAATRRVGHIESAHGGTLFLDEIGDLPIETQGHLLRFLQDRRVMRLGGSKALDVDVRIVAATHVDLEAAIRARTFREDLFYRLDVLTIHLPPLRERGNDILLLAHHLERQIAAEAGMSPPPFTPGALKALSTHGWPGNVREMIAVLRRAVLLAEGRPISEADLGLRGQLTARPDAVSRPPARRRPISAEEVRTALSEAGGNATEAARRLGVSRATFYRIARCYGLSWLRQPELS